jgi:hypothetical protein
MALMTCEECTAQISDTALACPQCGGKTKFAKDYRRIREIRFALFVLWPVVLWIFTVDLIVALHHWVKGGIDPITCFIQTQENKVGWGCAQMKLEIARWSAEANRIYDQHNWLSIVWLVCVALVIGFYIERYFINKRIGDRKP